MQSTMSLRPGLHATTFYDPVLEHLYFSLHGIDAAEQISNNLLRP